jgi:hypothetical protein
MLRNRPTRLVGVRTRYVTRDEVSIAKPLGWNRLNKPTSMGGDDQ